MLVSHSFGRQKVLFLPVFLIILFRIDSAAEIQPPNYLAQPHFLPFHDDWGEVARAACLRLSNGD